MIAVEDGLGPYRADMGVSNTGPALFFPALLAEDHTASPGLTGLAHHVPAIVVELADPPRTEDQRKLS